MCHELRNVMNSSFWGPLKKEGRKAEWVGWVRRVGRKKGMQDHSITSFPFPVLGWKLPPHSNPGAEQGGEDSQCSPTTAERLRFTRQKGSLGFSNHLTISQGGWSQVLGPGTLQALAQQSQATPTTRSLSKQLEGHLCEGGGSLKSSVTWNLPSARRRTEQTTPYRAASISLG